MIVNTFYKDLKMSVTNLKERGLKTTIPRIKILEILETSDKRHLSVEDIYRILISQNIEIGFATIYRVLSQFEKSDIVIKLNFDNQSVYELNRNEHHDHLVCVKCGKIEEFQDNIIEQHQQDVAKKLGYQLTDHCLYLYGICPQCR